MTDRHARFLQRKDRDFRLRSIRIMQLLHARLQGTYELIQHDHRAQEELFQERLQRFLREEKGVLERLAE